MSSSSNQNRTEEDEEEADDDDEEGEQNKSKGQHGVQEAYIIHKQSEYRHLNSIQSFNV